MKRGLNVISLILVLSILIPSLVFADTTPEPKKGTIPAIPIEELATLPIEKTYSYEEMLEIMKQNNEDLRNIEEFKNSHKENLKQINMGTKRSENMGTRSSGTVRYQVFRFDTESYVHNVFAYHIQPQIQVGLLYYAGPQPDSIVSLRNPNIYTSGRASSIDNGRFVYELISGNEFSIWVTGKLYDGGTTSVKGSIKIGLGEYAQATLEAENKGKTWIRDLDIEHTFYSSGLNK
ncbi:hypothetical protein ACTNDY_06410 [Tissierellaceae bacterium HCP3S3_D8]